MAFLNDITLGRYYPVDSFLHRLDPRSKLVASLVFMIGLFFAKSLSLIFIHAAVCAFGIYFSGIPAKTVLKNLRSFFWLFIITFLIHSLTTEGQTLFMIPILDWPITQEGLRNGLIFSSRLALLIFVAAILTMTTSPIELTDSLEKLFSPLKRFRIPVHEFALMVSLSLRFIPILIREAERIKNAQLSRGLSLEGSLLKRVRSIIPMLLPLFVSAIRRADELAVAMESRNYIGGAGRTTFRRLVFGTGDYFLLAFTSIFFAGVIAAT